MVNESNNGINEYEEAAEIITDYISENNVKYENKEEDESLYKQFQSKFSPKILKNLSDDELLNYLFLHDGDRNNLCHALEFDKDYEKFGSIKGGAAFKFKLFKHNVTGKWIYGSPTKKEKLTDENALFKGREIRDVLVKGAEIIQLNPLNNISDYEKLDKDLNNVLKTIKMSSVALWIHKYYHMIFPDKFPTFHNKQWQDYILEKFNIKPSSKVYGRSGQIALIVKIADLKTIFFQKVFCEKYGPLLNPKEKEVPVQNSKNIWLLAPGENAKYWDEFREKNMISIGWGDLGDLSKYNQSEDIKNALKTNYPEHYSLKSNPYNDTKALSDFSNEIKIDDLVFIKKGRNKLLGLGIVTSDYQFLEESIISEEDTYNNVREVRWLKIAENGEFDIPSSINSLPLKTLTNITDYEDFAFSLGRALNFPIDDYMLGENNQNIINNGGEISLDIYTKKDFLNEIIFIEEDYDELVNQINRKKNIILQGSPGVGKTFIAKRLAYSLMGSKDENRVEFVQFHQSYSYEDFIQGYSPTKEGFELNDGIFYKFCKKASKDPDNNYYFIIDEINRGNISKIFGELMMLIEEDKRGKDFAIQLTYQNESENNNEEKEPKFYVPENLHIIGMMNTADRSLAIIDYALRRRFVFFTIHPLFDEDYKNNNIFKDFLIENGVKEDLAIKIIDKFKALNNLILDNEDLGHGFRIGHSYFCGKCVKDEKWYRSIVNYEIAPLLKEYWFDDLDKAEEEIEKLLNI